MGDFTAAFIRRDRILFSLINQKLRMRFFDRWFGMLTNLGSTEFSILITSLFLYIQPETGERLATNLLISQIIIHALKRIINRPRPYEIMECNISFSPPECIYSFPSGHSGASLSIALVLSAALPALSPLLLFLAFLVSFSRIYLGYHFASDVTAGLLISYLTFLFFPHWILF